MNLGFRAAMSAAFLVTSPALHLGNAQEMECPRTSSEWTFCHTRPGLREQVEGKPEFGTLLYRGQELSDHVSREGLRISTPIGTYRYSEPGDVMDSGGWLPFSDRTNEQQATAGALMPLDAYSAGYHRTASVRRDSGTPEDWVFVEVDGQRESLWWTQRRRLWWADPARLDALPLDEEEETER